MSIDKSTVPIRPRNIRFPIDTVAEREWFDGDPLNTAYCDALSVLFPQGERFFIQSVQHYAEHIDDPVLRQAIRDFCIQEGFHTREHEAYNNRLVAEGIDLPAMEKRIAATLGIIKTPIMQLAITVAIEHLTATLGHVILGDNRLFAKAAEPYRDLWTWHALEEVEHKGVAYDVFLEVTKGLSRWKRYMLRCTAMFTVTTILHRIQLIHFIAILRHRGHSTSLRTRARFFWSLFGIPGFYRKGLIYYLRIYLPGFHPWKGDDGSLARSARDRFDQLARVDNVINQTDIR